ncbi:CAP domain-containing protein [Paracoccus sp. 12-3]|nr:CAP domain-containing protein [Paracoccus xiamenensis]
MRTDGHGEILVAAAGQARCVPTSPAAAAAALAATNRARAARGLAPLRTNARLQRAAEAHACEMAKRGAMTHAGTKTTGPMARAKVQGYAPRLTAENIAAGRFDLSRVLAEWSSSPDHLSNIVISGTQDFGIGQAVAADGKTTFWAAIYGKPRG